jgi:hypothetical protein
MWASRVTAITWLLADYGYSSGAVTRGSRIQRNGWFQRQAQTSSSVGQVPSPGSATVKMRDSPVIGRAQGWRNAPASGGFACVPVCFL